jgi:hypothetical protein
VDPRDLERLGAAQLGEDARQPAREHRLARAGRPHEQEVVTPSCGDLERTARTLLTAHVCEVGCRYVSPIGSERLVRWRAHLAAQIGDDLGEMPDTDGLDPCERRLGRRLGRAEDALEPGATRSLGDGEHARDRPDAPVERELTDGSVLGETLRRKLSRRTENGERDRKIEARALLAERCRGEIHREPLVERPLERRREDPAAHAVLGLLARAIGEPDDRKARHAR